MIITHNDLDGLVCGLLVCTFDTQTEEACRPFSYASDRDEDWRKLLETPTQAMVRSTDTVWFTDISLRPGELEWARNTRRPAKWVWIDHHPTSQKFEPQGIFDEVVVNCNGDVCAADLVWDQFRMQPMPDHTRRWAQAWVDVAHDHDLWIHEERMRNRMLDLILRHPTTGWIDLVKRALRQSPQAFLNGTPNATVQDVQRSYAETLSLANKTRCIIDGPIPCVFAYVPKHQSFIADELYNTGDEIICMVNLTPKGVVLNMRTKRDDISVGVIAERMGGGGHPRAAGAPLESELLEGGFRAIYEKMLATDKLRSILRDPDTPVCSVDDCIDPAKTRGMCIRHYHRVLRQEKKEKQQKRKKK